MGMRLSLAAIVLLLLACGNPGSCARVAHLPLVSNQPKPITVDEVVVVSLRSARPAPPPPTGNWQIHYSPPPPGSPPPPAPISQ